MNSVYPVECLTVGDRVAIDDSQLGQVTSTIERVRFGLDGHKVIKVKSKAFGEFYKDDDRWIFKTDNQVSILRGIAIDDTHSD